MLLYNNDCVDQLRLFKNECIDMTVMSPPYDNLRTYNLDKLQVDYKELAKELYRTTKKGGVVAWVVQDQTLNGDKTLSSFRQAIIFQEAGFKVHDVMIWRKDTSAFPRKNGYANVFEYIFIFSKRRIKTFNPIEDRKNKSAGEKIHGTLRLKDGTSISRKEFHENWGGKEVSAYGRRFNVWDIPTEKVNKTGHPAVFPLKLASDLIMSWTNEGDVILDPFMGSGTTGIACQQLNRRFIGIELNKEFFENTKRRLNENNNSN